MIKPLIWKEWREQRWKMIFGTVMMLSFTGSFLAARIVSDQEILIVIWVFGGLTLALYSAMGVFSLEWTGRTTQFLISKPVAGWKIFACKWLMGWLNFAVPMIVCSLCLLLINIGWDAGKVIKGTFASLSLASIFYSMICCLAPRKSSEAMVGFVGVLVSLSIMFHFIIAQIIVPRSNFQDISFFQEIFMFLNPVLWMMLIKPISAEMSEEILFFLIEQGLLFAIVIWIGLRKWQRSS